MYKKFNRIHFIGIGGIGMSGIAELLVRNGYAVSGSDMNRGESVRSLEALGVRVFIGHHTSNIEGAELLVYSSAIRPENPERQRARELDIPSIPRAEMLAELMRIKYGVAIAGAHGKTTTTSMVAKILVDAGLDPTVVVGGRMDSFGGTNARLGSGEFMVVEADESDGSFNKLSPAIGVVTNVDREHMDFYGTMPRLKKAFLSFLNKVPFYGLSIFCGDDPYLRLLNRRVERRKKTFGFTKDNHYLITNYDSSPAGGKFNVRCGAEEISLSLRVPGRHNVLNAVAAFAVADELDVDRKMIARALADFQGVQRRFQRRGELNGVTFIDDYAHHPTEIRATLQAARERFPNSRIRAIFQPHRFSRTEDLLDQFATCFRDSDDVAVINIYAAGEAPVPGFTGQTVVDAMKRAGVEKVAFESTAQSAVDRHLGNSNTGDVIITLGAGDLPNVYRDLFPN